MDDMRLRIAIEAVNTARAEIAAFANEPFNLEQLAYAFDGLTADERAADPDATTAMNAFLEDVQKLGDLNAETDFVAPTIELGIHGDPDSAEPDKWVLPGDNVYAAFVSPEESNTEGGIIILSETLMQPGEEGRLADLAMEELGEALGVYAASEEIGMTVAEGDVGARMLKVSQYDQPVSYTHLTLPTILLV